MATQKLGREARADPMVEVRRQDVEQFIGCDDGPATVMRPQYELFPDGSYLTWPFRADSLEDDAESLARAIDEKGVPLMRSLDSRSAVEAALRDWTSDHVRLTRLPALLLAGGNEAAAREAIADELERVRDISDAGFVEASA